MTKVMMTTAHCYDDDDAPTTIIIITVVNVNGYDDDVAPGLPSS